MNREGWLTALVELLRPHFAASHLPLPERVHVSVGWPASGGLSRKSQRLGECWMGSKSEDGAPHIFISPALAGGMQAADVLVHELVHAALPEDAKHGPKFKAAMKLIGLVGRPSSAEAGPELREKLAALIEELGPYPHAALMPSENAKKQNTRMLKITCPRHKDYIVRASRKLIKMGLPACGLCVKDNEVRLMEAEQLPEEDAQEEGGTIRDD